MSFQRFGAVTIDWPHKMHSKSRVPPKGVYYYVIINLDISRLYLLMSLTCTNSYHCPFYVGFAFLLFKDEAAVHQLLTQCVVEGDKLFIYVKYVTGAGITRKKVHFA